MAFDPMKPNSAAQVLSLVAARGVSLHAYDGRLRSSGPPGAIDAVLANGLSKYRNTILASLVDDRFYPGNQAQVMAAAHWHAEREAILDCPRLAPAPQGTPVVDAALPAIGSTGSIRLLAALVFTLARWTGSDTVAIRLVTVGGTVPLRAALTELQSFADLCQQVLRSYRRGARFRRDGGEAMRSASLACQVELDFVQHDRPRAESASPAWLRFVRAPGSGTGHWVVRHAPDVFDATQAAWFAAAVCACLEHVSAAPHIPLAPLAARVTASTWQGDRADLFPGGSESRPVPRAAGPGVACGAPQRCLAAARAAVGRRRPYAL
jgi:hypothetical protein